jgi:hypothetical protein
MALVELILGEESFSVVGRSLRYSYDKVTSTVSLEIVRLFVDPVNGKEVKATSDNVAGLTQLSQEFGFWWSSAKLSDSRLTELRTRLRRRSRHKSGALQSWERKSRNCTATSF